MVERLDGESMGDDVGTESQNTLGLEGIDIELQDYKDAAFPKAEDLHSKPKGKKGGKGSSTVAAGERENDEVVMFGKLGSSEISRKLSVQGQGAQDKTSGQQKADWARTTGDPGFGQAKTKFQRYCPLLSGAALQPYFNINSKQMRTRLLQSLIPFNAAFYPMYAEQPDLYGPFWILTSLIVSLFISGNISRFIRDGVDDFEYNFTVIPVAAFIIYGVGICFPLMIKLLLNLYGTSDSQTPLVNAVGIYGYSFSSFLVTSILCAIPSDGLQWLLISYSAVTSVGFLMRTYWDDFKESLDAKVRWIAVGFVCSVQLILLLIFKIYFFKHV